MERTQIQTTVFRAIDRVNEVLLDENMLAKETTTILVGPGAVLDSMGFVNFIVALEEEIAEATGLNLNLVEQLNAADNTAQKPATVGELSEFVFRLVQKPSLED